MCSSEWKQTAQCALTCCRKKSRKSVQRHRAQVLQCTRMSSGGVISVCIRIKITPGVEKLVPNWLLVVYPELIHRAEEPKNKKNLKNQLSECSDTFWNVRARRISSRRSFCSPLTVDLLRRGSRCVCVCLSGAAGGSWTLQRQIVKLTEAFAEQREGGRGAHT